MCMPTIVQTVRIPYAPLLVVLQRYDLSYQSLAGSHVPGRSPHHLSDSSKLFVCSAILGVGRRNGRDGRENSDPGIFRKF